MALVFATGPRLIPHRIAVKGPDLAEIPVAVVTGASSGIGKATALMLAQRGWHVICVGRNLGRIALAESEIRDSVANARLDFIQGDFDEMRDVLRVATQIRSLSKRVDVLINNAGGVRDQRYVTPEGIEATFAANHLAAFLLTRELMRPLKAAAAYSRSASRVLGVSSTGHSGCAAMHWADLNLKDHFTPVAAYSQAKLANILFTRELARRAVVEGIVAHCMHPGRVASNFASHGDTQMRHYMQSATTTSPERPAETLVWLATGVEGGRASGRYFHNLEEVAPAPQALDDAAAHRLWEESERLLHRLGL